MKSDTIDRGCGKTLLVSIHDVSPAFQDRIARLLVLLDRCGIDRGALLVVPNFHGEWPIDAFPAFRTAIQDLLVRGWELVLHGLTHREAVVVPSSGMGDRIAARMLTDREGEFLRLDPEEVKRRLVEGRQRLVATWGREPVGFVAPAWLSGGWLHQNLRDLGFRYTEGHFYIEEVTADRRIFSPVVAWASRTPVRLMASRIWARLATPWLSRLPVARVALHPRDVDHRSLIDSIRATLDRFTDAGFQPSTYADFLGRC